MFDSFFGDDSPNVPPPPDFGPVVSSLKDQAAYAGQLTKEQQDWAKQTFAENKGQTDAINSKLSDTLDYNLQNAKKDRARYEGTFQPLEDKLVSEANDYASEGRKDLERGRAMANVGEQFEAQRQNTMRDLESYGINPGAVRYAGLDTAYRAQQAATQAAAANQSDQAVDATGRALRSEAINVGKTLPGQALAGQGVGMQAGQGAVGNNLSTTASGANTMGTGLQWGAQGISANSTAADAMTNQYKAQMAQYEAETKKKENSSSGIGSALGLAGSVIGGIYGGPMGASIGGSIGSSAGSMFAAEGGAIPDPNEDPTANPNMVPVSASPSRGQAIDDVPAQVTPGEFIFPVDVSSWYGEKYLQNMIVKAREGKANAGAQPEQRPAPASPPTYRSPSAQQALPVG